MDLGLFITITLSVVVGQAIFDVLIAALQGILIKRARRKQLARLEAIEAELLKAEPEAAESK